MHLVFPPPTDPCATCYRCHTEHEEGEPAAERPGLFDHCPFCHTTWPDRRDAHLETCVIKSDRRRAKTKDAAPVMAADEPAEADDEAPSLWKQASTRETRAISNGALSGRATHGLTKSRPAGAHLPHHPGRGRRSRCDPDGDEQSVDAVLWLVRGQHASQSDGSATVTTGRTQRATVRRMVSQHADEQTPSRCSPLRSGARQAPTRRTPSTAATFPRPVCPTRTRHAICTGACDTVAKDETFLKSGRLFNRQDTKRPIGPASPIQAQQTLLRVQQRVRHSLVTASAEPRYAELCCSLRQPSIVAGF